MKTKLQPGDHRGTASQNDALRERLAFVTLVIHIASGELNDFLQNAPVGLCAELAKIWDAYCKIPIGNIFARPNFEAYEAINRAAWQYPKTINKNTKS